MKRILALALLLSTPLLAQNFNLNNTTPAAPGGGTNCLWQKDASATVNVSCYIASGVFAKLAAANTFGAFLNDFSASTWEWPACAANAASATNTGCTDASTGPHVWDAQNTADIRLNAITGGGGSNIITPINGVNQGTGATGGTAGVSVSCSFPSVSPNVYAQKGDATHPQLGMIEFQTPGTLTTAVRIDCALTMPSNYTANGTVTLHGLAGCTGSTNSATYTANYSDITLGGALNSTLSGDFSSASTSTAAVPSLTAITVAITTPTINPGDLVSISFRVSADASACAPVVPQLYASY